MSTAKKIAEALINNLPNTEPAIISMDKDEIDMDALNKVSLQIMYRVIHKEDNRASMSSYKDIEDVTNPEMIHDIINRQLKELLNDLPLIATLTVKLAEQRAETEALLEKAIVNPTIN